MGEVILFLGVVVFAAIILYLDYRRGDKISTLRKFKYVDKHSDYFFKPPTNMNAVEWEDTISIYNSFVKNNFIFNPFWGKVRFYDKKSQLYTCEYDFICTGEIYNMDDVPKNSCMWVEVKTIMDDVDTLYEELKAQEEQKFKDVVNNWCDNKEEEDL